MFQREIREKLIEYNRNFPIVSVTGPRQSGKTTLCKMVFPGYEYMNLEDEESRDIVKQDIKGFLRKYGKGLVIDEVHRLPEIFPHSKLLPMKMIRGDTSFQEAAIG